MTGLKRDISEYYLGLVRALTVLSCCLVTALPLSSHGQIVLNEIRSDGGSEWTVEIKNLGGSTVNVGGYFLCNYPSYSPLLSLDVECGSLLLESGGLVVVSGFEGGTSADGEMGLYINGAFSNPASIIDYVEWGSSGHQRASVAISAGIWTAMDSVAGFGDGHSIEYSGSGNTSASWEIETIVQSICSENPPGENCNTVPGSLSTGDPTVICSGDGLPDIVDVSVSGAMGDNSFWMITDTAGMILDVPVMPPFDFEGDNEGICWIFHVVYNGEISGAEVGMNLADLSGCWQSSNAVEIVKRTISGGTIATSDPTTICAGDTIPDPINVTLIDTVGDQSAWVITDESGLILSLPAGPPFDLNDAGPGISRIWHLSYNDGLTGLAMGNDLDDLDGCFELSNFIEVIHNVPEGGIIGTAVPEACLVQANQDTIYFSLADDRGTLNSWIVTDTNFVITGLQEGPAFTFSGDAGVCLIWHISYEPGLAGLSIGESALDLAGCFDLSNAVAVIKRKPESGTISTADNTVFCIGQGGGDTVVVDLTGASGSNQQYVVTDPDGDIVGLPGSNIISFDSYAAGHYEIVHISYTDGLSGLVIGQPFDGLNGCFEVSNAIVVERNLVIGGAISTPDETVMCLLGSTVDSVHVQLAGAIGVESAWLVTDTAGIILELPDGPDFGFSGMDGTCLIWHLSYVDGLTGLSVGENIAGLGGCYDLSNSITVVKNRPDGGVISTAGPTTFCNGDGADSISVSIAGAVGANGQWMIVTIGGTILELPEGPPFDLSGYDAGTYVIFHLSFADGLTGLQVGNTTGDLTGCWEISNPIVLQLQVPEGGVITFLSDSIVCAVDDYTDTLNFELEGSSGSGSIWLVLDNDGEIVLISESGSGIVLDYMELELFLVLHISYDGVLTGAEIGNQIADLGGCFDLSNYLPILWLYPIGGALNSNDPLSYCQSDTLPRIVGFEPSGVEATELEFVVIANDGTILELIDDSTVDFSAYPAGEYMVTAVASYFSEVSGLEAGENIADADGCFSLSSEPLEVFIGPAPVAASIIYEGGSDAEEFCSGDGIADTIRIDRTGDTSQFTAWIITEEDGRIAWIDEGLQPLYPEGIVGGELEVRHIAYQGSLQGLTVGANLADLQGCFALSNALTLYSLGVNGGTISTDDDTELCVNDGLADQVEVDLIDAAGEFSTWIITDASGVILGISEGPVFEFDSSAAGTCRIWHLAHASNVVGLEPGQPIEDLFGCFDLSNAIMITKADAGPVCENVGVNDLPSDLLRFDLYPNPADRHIRMEAVFSEMQEYIRVAVYNSIGILQMQIELSDRADVTEDISVQHLSNGHYFLRIAAEGGTVTRPFLKQ